MKPILVSYVACTCGNVVKGKGYTVTCGACGKVLRTR